MSIGQEGDTRKYRKLKRTDWYESKPAVEEEKHQPRSFPKCRTCGQYITGQSFGSPPKELYCLRCSLEATN